MDNNNFDNLSGYKIKSIKIKMPKKNSAQIFWDLVLFVKEEPGMADLLVEGVKMTLNPKVQCNHWRRYFSGMHEAIKIARAEHLHKEAQRAFIVALEGRGTFSGYLRNNRRKIGYYKRFFDVLGGEIVHQIDRLSAKSTLIAVNRVLNRKEIDQDTAFWRMKEDLERRMS